MRAEGLCTYVPWSGSRTFQLITHSVAASTEVTDSTFVDDTVLLMAPSNPNDVVPYIKIAAKAAIATFHGHAAEINFKKVRPSA